MALSAFTLKFHPAFVDELEGALAYYSDKSNSLGKRYKQAVKKALTLLKESTTIKFRAL